MISVILQISPTCTNYFFVRSLCECVYMTNLLKREEGAGTGPHMLQFYLSVCFLHYIQIFYIFQCLCDVWEKTTDRFCAKESNAFHQWLLLIFNYITFADINGGYVTRENAAEYLRISFICMWKIHVFFHIF